MKSLALIFLVGLTVIVLANGLPANDKKVGNSHKLKASTSTTTISPGRKCDTVCTLDYKPICGSDGQKVNLSFGNKCVMENYNCEHNTKLTVKSEGECPNSKGIRLA
ncbi:ovomucoid-like [Adelges cooleyi]|uniref:ovomucoid-like n=1 Tax=Adelges cooleyi TaxID=133065 RepID=UPI002180217B|nr:ovomucoid-like [Adelges cooleyi]